VRCWLSFQWFLLSYRSHSLGGALAIYPCLLYFTTVLISRYYFSGGESYTLANPDGAISVSIDCGEGGKFTRRDFKLSDLKTIVNKWQTFMIDNGGWNALYMENHDQSRTVTRYASDATPELRIASSKMLATHLALQSGTPFVYQGQELAQINIPRSWGMEKYRDIEYLNHWNKVLKKHPNDKQFQEDTKREYWLKSRDNARTPMQWDDSPNAGFCPEGVTPWMDVHEDFQEWNAAKQKVDEDSPYRYWRKVLDLRKSKKDVFVYGDFKMVDIENGDVCAYTRSEMEGKGKALVVTSFANKEIEWKLPVAEQKLFSQATVALKNYADGPQGRIEEGVLQLRPYEAFVLLVD
jgi:glycosidase